MSLIRRALFVVAIAALSPTTIAAPKSQPLLITVELDHTQIRNFYERPKQATVEPGGFEVPPNATGDWITLGFKPNDIILTLNGNPVGERLSVSDGIHVFDVLRGNKPVVLRVIVHAPPRKSTTLDEDQFDKLIGRLDPTNGPHTTPVSNASGPSGVRVTGAMIALYLSCDVGDIIRTIDNQPVRTDAEVITALKALRIGTTEITFDRLGKPMTLTIVRKAPLDLTGVRRISPTKFEVTRAFADAIKADHDILSRKLSTTPNVRNGKQHGYTLYDIKPDAPAAVLGLVDGDVVLDVDGNRIDSHSDIRLATEQLEHVVSLEVHIERKGKPVTLRYVIR